MQGGLTGLFNAASVIWILMKVEGKTRKSVTHEGGVVSNREGEKQWENFGSYQNQPSLVFTCPVQRLPNRFQQLVSRKGLLQK